MRYQGKFCSLLLGLALAAVGAQKNAVAEDAPTAPPVPKAADTAKPADSKEVAVIKTTEGTMVVEFWTDAAPKTIANFKKLAKSGFYDGTCFHRVIPGFMIQGGDPNTKDASKEGEWGMGGPGYQIDAEFNDHSHERGVISMARSSDPNSAGSQFFICHGSPTQLDHQYTTFGKLTKGFDVLDKIATTPTHRPDRPNTRMGIISIKIVPASEAQ
ncbi:MAG TPA: peptidylprolyl isomerase [Verrucomicrobiae bacterium]|jgi:peptidyl-prolyl cis-trans isomerase B (cyclophilin B)|nr:peptidylprolyl isomerase [Verrucomicrobiae bacterium]